MAWISVAAVIDVVWLHAAAYGVDLSAFSRCERLLWGLAVPWFFVSAMFWLTVKWRGFKVEMGRRVRSLLVPYFLWCVLGSLWSIVLHGVQFRGWELLRYLGLHPWLDPAYQPMWFIRNLFLVLLVEAGLLGGFRRFRGLRWFKGGTFGGMKGIRSFVFPIYVIHSMWLSVARVVLGKQRFEGVELSLVVVGTLVLSALCAWMLRKTCPKAAELLFGGR